MNKPIEIDKNIPLPKGRGGIKCYPYEKMKIGDSFYIPGATGRGGQYGNAKRFGIKIVCASATENGIQGYRVWRVK